MARREIRLGMQGRMGSQLAARCALGLGGCGTQGRMAQAWQYTVDACICGACVLEVHKGGRAEQMILAVVELCRRGVMQARYVCMCTGFEVGKVSDEQSESVSRGPRAAVALYGTASVA